LAPFSSKEAKVRIPKNGHANSAADVQFLTHMRGVKILGAFGPEEADFSFKTPLFSLTGAMLKREVLPLAIIRRQFPAAYSLKVTVNDTFTFYITDTLPENEKWRDRLSQTTYKSETWYMVPSDIFRETGNTLTVEAQCFWSEFNMVELYPSFKEGPKLNP